MRVPIGVVGAVAAIVWIAVLSVAARPALQPSVATAYSYQLEAYSVVNTLGDKIGTRAQFEAYLKTKGGKGCELIRAETYPTNGPWVADAYENFQSKPQHTAGPHPEAFISFLWRCPPQ